MTEDMEKLISIPFKTLLRKFHNAEHYFFFNSNLIRLLVTPAGNLPTISSFYSFFWHSVQIKRFSTDPTVLQAIHTLLFLENTYKGLAESTYAEQTGLVTNFLQACDNNIYKPLIQSLGLQPIIDEVRVAHNSFITLYDDRMMDKEHIAQLGKLADLRLEVDAAFSTFVDVVNSAWITNELSAKDTTVRTNLIEVRDIVSGAIHQGQERLARRGIHHKPKDDGKGDNNSNVGTQTPDATNPPAPNVPPQTPDTNPPTVNPDDLNPPAVGEH